MEVILVILAIVGGIIAFFIHANAKRRKALLEKYGDAALVERLMNGEVWEGQTAEQLIDAMGRPIETDKKVLKTRSREIWKYDQTSKKRFGLRVTVENGTVIGWDKKA